jgi:hypothetical protein
MASPRVAVSADCRYTRQGSYVCLQVLEICKHAQYLRIQGNAKSDLAHGDNSRNALGSDRVSIFPSFPL